MFSIKLEKIAVFLNWNMIIYVAISGLNQFVIKFGRKWENYKKPCIFKGLKDISLHENIAILSIINYNQLLG